MKKVLILFFLFLTIPLIAQKSVYDYHSYSLKTDSQSVKALSNDGNLIYQKIFFHPEDYITDLDSDGVNELVVIDYLENNNRKFYTLFIYNTIDTFYLADSIYSGSVKPYEDYSEDINGMVYVTGDTRFDTFNTDSTISFLPVNCWKFEDGAVFLANASVYDVFMNENDLVLQTIDDYYDTDGRTCSTTHKIQGAIASGFINYYNTGEHTVANQFLKKYYLCNDAEYFKMMLLKIFNNQK